MTAKAFITALPSFQGLDGLPLTAGYVYFGQPNQDPRQYPKTVYYDQALTVSAGSVLRTAGGYLYRNGSPTNVWADGSASVLVTDSQQRQVYYFADWAGIGVIADIAALSGSVADLAALAPHADDIGDLAPHVTDLGDLAPQAANIGTLAPQIANINTVAGSIASVQQVASNITLVSQAAAATRIFASTAAGIAGTTNGQYFYVVSASASNVLELWLNNAGVASDTGKRYLASGSIAALINEMIRKTTASRNVFNPAAISAGTFINGTTGATGVNASNYATDYMPVQPGGNIISSHTSLAGWAFYDENKVFVTGSTALSGGAALAAGVARAVPAGCYFARIGYANTVPSAQLMVMNTSTLPSNYQAWGEPTNAIGSTLIQHRSSLIDADGSNIYNPALNTQGMINATTGAFSGTDGSHRATDYMPVIGGYPVTLGLPASNDLANAGLAWYDSSQVFISGIVGSQVSGAVLTPPFNAAYLRIGARLSSSPGFLTGTINIGKAASIKKADIITNYTRDVQDAAWANDILGLQVHDFTTDVTGILDSNTGTVGGASGLTTAFMPISGGVSFFMTGATSGLDSGHGIAFYDKDQVYISGIGGNQAAYTVLTAPLRARYFRVSTLSGTATTWPATQIIIGGSGKVTESKKLRGLQWADKKLITLGDSISTPTWFNEVTSRLAMTHKINAAASGRTTANALFLSDNVTPLQASDFSDVSLCFIDLGINNNVAAIGDIGSANNSATFYGNMKNTIETILGWNPLCRIVISTLLYSPLRTAQTTAFNPAIKEIANYYAIPMFDLFNLSGVSAFNSATLLSDGLHPNTNGYVRGLIPALTGFLRSIEPAM